MRGLRRMFTTMLLALLAARLCLGECTRKASGHAKPRNEPITVPTHLLLAHAVTRVTPTYPADAMAAKVDGAVIIALEVDHEGNVTETRPLSGNPSLRPAAEDAVRRWHFESFCIKGVPYTVRGALEFQFRWRGDGSRVQQP